jgi:hypothetical protein
MFAPAVGELLNGVQLSSYVYLERHRASRFTWDGGVLAFKLGHWMSCFKLDTGTLDCMIFELRTPESDAACNR